MVTSKFIPNHNILLPPTSMITYSLHSLLCVLSKSENVLSLIDHELFYYHFSIFPPISNNIVQLNAAFSIGTAMAGFIEKPTKTSRAIYIGRQLVVYLFKSIVYHFCSYYLQNDICQILFSLYKTFHFEIYLVNYSLFHIHHFQP